MYTFTRNLTAFRAEDLGSQGRTSNIANHALVFMVHGLSQKWKQ